MCWLWCMGFVCCWFGLVIATRNANRVVCFVSIHITIRGEHTTSEARLVLLVTVSRNIYKFIFIYEEFTHHSQTNRNTIYTTQSSLSCRMSRKQNKLRRNTLAKEPRGEREFGVACGERVEKWLNRRKDGMKIINWSRQSRSAPLCTCICNSVYI